MACRPADPARSEFCRVPQVPSSDEHVCATTIVSRTRRSWSAGSEARQPRRQLTGGTAATAAAAAAASRPISVRFCESAATSRSLTSCDELTARSTSRPVPAFDGVDAAAAPLVSSHCLSCYSACC